jgi:hypothetical protein
MAVVSSCRENFLEKSFIKNSRSFGKGVLLSQETNETHAASCYCSLRGAGTLAGPLVLNQRKEWTTAGLYGPNLLGLHAAYNARDNGMQHRKVKLISKPTPSSDRGLQLALVKPEFLVSEGHHSCERRMINTPQDR